MSRGHEFGSLRKFIFGPLVLALFSCASPNPLLYTILPIDGAARPAGPKIVLLQQITLARYLERSQIVRSSEGYRLEVMANDWWGESLRTMMSRVLVLELGQRLPQSVVLADDSAVTASPDATIDLNIQRLDEDTAGALVLQAQASVAFNGQRTPMLQSFHIAVPPTAPGVPGEVAAISSATGQLADWLASVLTSRHASS